MATRCCQSALQASSSGIAGVSADCLRKSNQLKLPPWFRDGAPCASHAPARKVFGSSSEIAREMGVRSSVETSGSATTSGAFWRDYREPLEELEDVEVMLASDPASSWDDEDDSVLSEDDENSPSHWLREWAEDKGRGMHQAAEVAYSALADSTCCTGTNHSGSTTLVMGMGLALTLGLAGLGLVEPAAAAEALGGNAVTGEVAGLFANEPANALSLPTWVIHVASVVEWITAIALVWRYGDSDEPGRKAWKGLAWGMVPLLAGALCACTWHFFYNAPSLEFIVALQGFFTVLGNCTLWAAAFRIYQQAQKTA